MSVHQLRGERTWRRRRENLAPEADPVPQDRRVAAAAAGVVLAVPTAHRPDLIELTDRQRNRVSELVRQRGWRCTGCGGRQVTVGDALYLGFLFRSEDTDAYMVGLTCVQPQCGHPRDAIRLHERDFAVDAADVGG